MLQVEVTDDVPVVALELTRRFEPSFVNPPVELREVVLMWCDGASTRSMSSAETRPSGAGKR